MKTNKALSSFVPSVLGALCIGLMAGGALAANPQVCNNYCASERAECLVAAKDLGLSAVNHRKNPVSAAAPVSRKQKVLDTLMAKLEAKDGGSPPMPAEQRMAIADELQSRGEDRIKGCDRTYNNCAAWVCGGPVLALPTATTTANAPMAAAAVSAPSASTAP